MILRIILYVFLAYLLYNIIFRFIIPVYKTTRQVKKGFREMSARMNHSDGQSRMNEHNRQQQEYAQPNKTDQSPSSQKPNGDYIDFEEIK